MYLPQEMKLVKFLPDGSLYEEILPQGHRYVEIALNEVALFIRQGKCIPLAREAQYVEAIDTTHMTMIGYAGSSYILYEDDGIHKDYEDPANYRELKF